jgi:3-oxoacyl-[acyl-carrier-protein] synthase-3
VYVAGTGRYLPERVLTNADLEKMVDTSDEWIWTRTGIRERRLAADGEASSDMGSKAALQALEDAGVSAEEVGLIIVATVTPDMPFPSTACLVQAKIGAKNAMCFDLEAACSGFIYSLETARALCSTGTCDTALVIGSDKMSGFVDWEDRATCVLFGDGAGAFVLRAGDADGAGILSAVLGADGTLSDLLTIPGGGSLHPASHETIDDRMHFVKMEGNVVFKQAVRGMSDAAAEALSRSGLSGADVDWVVPHQANMRIIRAVADRMGVSLDRVCINMEHVGNTTAASVPLAFRDAVDDGRIKKGDVVLFTVFGGGLSWGAAVIRY